MPAGLEPGVGTRRSRRPGGLPEPARRARAARVVAGGHRRRDAWQPAPLSPGLALALPRDEQHERGACDPGHPREDPKEGDRRERGDPGHHSQPAEPGRQPARARRATRGRPSRRRLAPSRSQPMSSSEVRLGLDEGSSRVGQSERCRPDDPAECEAEDEHSPPIRTASIRSRRPASRACKPETNARRAERAGRNATAMLQLSCEVAYATTSAGVSPVSAPRRCEQGDQPGHEREPAEGRTRVQPCA